MKDFLSYTIRIPIATFELEELAKVFISDINELPTTEYMEQTIKDIIIFQTIFAKTIEKLDMDRRRERIEGYKRTKPYTIKMTKPKIYWLYRYIEVAQLVELSNLHSNILGPHISELIKD